PSGGSVGRSAGAPSSVVNDDGAAPGDPAARGAPTMNITEEFPTIAVTPKMAPEAYYGLAGRIVAAIEPYSEADPVPIRAHVLVGVGNLIGRGPHALVERTTHTCGEFVVLVGDTAKGRKGQAWSTPRYLLRQADGEWASACIKHGLSSGEGVIHAVRDPRWGV